MKDQTHIILFFWNWKMVSVLPDHLECTVYNICFYALCSYIKIVMGITCVDCLHVQLGAQLIAFEALCQNLIKDMAVQVTMCGCVCEFSHRE